MTQRILICDDEAHIRRAVSMKLCRAGYDVHAVSDGRYGLEAFQEETPALIITDLQMPRMDGLELSRQVRALDEGRDIPIILLTAKRFELDTDRICADLKIAEVVMKPFSPRELLALVNTLIEPQPQNVLSETAD